MEKYVNISEVANTIEFSGLRVGIMHWHSDNDYSRQLARILSELGCDDVIHFNFDAKLPEGQDIIVIFGPFGTLTPVIKQLKAYPKSERPSLLYLMTEQLPDPYLPEWFRYGFGRLLSRAERMAYYQRPQGNWRLRSWARWLTSKGHRFRYYGDLFWMQQEEILTTLSIGSFWTADRLRAKGFNPIVLPCSYSPTFGRDLNLERDIPVLWLGKMGSARRRSLVNKIREQLRGREVEMLVIDGEENSYVFGEARTVLMNRTKIALNLVREKWDDNSARYSLAAANRTMIVSEPTLPHTPFEPGVHLVEAPIDQIAETILYYLAHDEEREQIADRAYELIRKFSDVDNAKKLFEETIKARRNMQSAA
jgi:hypothetical protein